MTRHTNNAEPGQITNDRVAPRLLLVIPEGDAVPSTHTDPAAVTDRTITSRSRRQHPLPFAAGRPKRRMALVPWWSLLLSALALAVIGAATTSTAAPPAVGAAAVVVTGAGGLALVVVELIYRLERSRR